MACNQAPSYANLGRNTQYAIPDRTGNGHMYDTSTWGQTGEVCLSPSQTIKLTKLTAAYSQIAYRTTH